MALKKIPSWIWVTTLYLVSHVPALTLLPVFADEAIYIRWAQLVIDDVSRYAFFSMSDGKPPLFMWLLSLTLRPFSDPLFAGRLTALGIGLGTVFVMGATAKLLTGNRRIALLVELMTMFAPFWWFYHRMALMDGLLTFCLTSAFYFAVKIVIRCQKESGIAFDTIPYILCLGISFGGALLTKTPALFAIPGLALTPLLAFVQQRQSTRNWSQKFFESGLLVGIGGVIGCVCFLLLRVSPFFGTLFARGSDFTFTVGEVIRGEWKFVLFSSLPREGVWIATYCTFALIGMMLFGLFSWRRRRLTLFLLTSAIVFALPLVAFGRVLYPRYFLPVAPFLTLAGAIGLEEAWRQSRTKILAGILVLGFGIQSLLFIFPAIVNPARIPFVPIDRVQYLEEWSAGYGNAQVRDFIRARYALFSYPKRIIVLTEGAFGTLPDGLLMYFYGQNQLNGVEIHGVGVGPSVLPEEYLRQLKTAEVYYVVNSHRLKIVNMSKLQKIMEIKRPNHAPSLLLFKVTQ